MFNFLKSKKRKIIEFEMPPTMFLKFRTQYNWDKSTCQHYIEEYKKFMLLASERQSVPSKIVDLVWHEHILHTRSYEEFCKILGRFIHHNPAHVPNTNMYQETKRNYESSGFVDSNSSLVWGDFPQNDFSNSSVISDTSVSTFEGGAFGGSGAGSDWGGSSDSTSSCSSCGSSCGSD